MHLSYRCHCAMWSQHGDTEGIWEGSVPGLKKVWRWRRKFFFQFRTVVARIDGLS